MKEHRLIERAIAVLNSTLTHIEATGAVDPLRIDTVVDFISTYADRTHHGKEEDILFSQLDKKTLSSADRDLMEELLEEHRIGRLHTQSLTEARSRYCTGDERALADISSSLQALVDLYPRHIDKEDNIFFPHSRQYLSDEEDRAMMAEFAEFDRGMIHRKYKAVIESLEG